MPPAVDRMAPSSVREMHRIPRVQWFRILAVAATVAVAYYAGAIVGLALRLPATTPSIVWPPNAILTATLIATRPREWPFYVAAVLPSHFVTESHAGWPFALILALLATNCGESILAAASVRRFSEDPARLDTLRQFGIFVAGVVVAAPLLTTFPDAAAVHWLRGEPYWRVWANRFLSNMLAAVVVVPAVLSLAAVVRGVRHATPKRLAEALLLVVSFAAASLLATGRPLHSAVIGIMSAHAPFLLILPVVLWAAVRFGPTGASLTLLTATLWVLWLATGSAAFASPAGNDAINALQLSLIGLSIPVLALSVSIAERERVRGALARQLGFEALLSRLSRRFVRLRGGEVQHAFAPSLAQIGAFLGLPNLLLCSASEGGFTVLERWLPDATLPLSNLHRDLPWIKDQVSRRRSVAVADLSRSSDEMGPDRSWLESIGVVNVIAVPVVDDHAVVGALVSFGSDPLGDGSNEMLSGLQLTADVFANALARVRSEAALRASELETHRIRTELTHVARVSTMGALTASLAHQLNQPLQGILSNAQAARRLLDRGAPDLSAVLASLADIIADDRRASEVIGRIHGLLRKDDPEVLPVDVNAIVGEVARLVASDALMHRVTILLELHPEPLVVRGDRVQLQQVFLNVLLNAIEALSGSENDRRVAVRTVATPSEAQISIADTGAGFADLANAFEAFYTTKPSGLGVGLSIARSIVAMHAGSIAAGNLGSGGAFVEMTLPRFVPDNGATADEAMGVAPTSTDLPRFPRRNWH
jgi:two-component system, LuxR family, sensor kinase FixL